MKKTMDQHRACWAWAQTLDNPSKDYVSLVEGTPATILMCGLGQTVAFFMAKDEQHKRVLTNLASWLLVGKDNPDHGEKREKTGEDLLLEITSKDRDRYHELTDEALEYLIWLKRFAKARKKD